MSDFVHLHVHSEFSLLDGLSKISDLISKTKKYGQNAIALTDHGVMYGAIEFYKKATKAEVKPIIGCEVYVAENSRLDKKRSDARHLVLLAKDIEGYRNLLRLSTIGQTEGFYYKPRVDKEMLLKYHKGLIATTACAASQVQQHLIHDDYQAAKKEAKELEQIFGSGNFYLELQRHHFDEYAKQPEVPDSVKRKILESHEHLIKGEKGLIKLSQELGIPLIATNDVHYVEKDDARAQDAIVCIQTGKVISDVNRMRYIDTPDFYLKSPEEMEKNFSDLPEAISNTKKVADLCNIEIKLGQWYFPPVDLPKGKTAAQALREKTLKGAKEKFTKITPEIKERINYELDVIEKKGYPSYFLLFSQIVEFCDSVGITTNTRGSAAGCFVSYSCGITTVDPLRFHLPFERFLNPFRPSLPDIDLDVSDDRREEIFEFLKEHYGHDQVAQICTFGTMKARMAVRDIGRVLGMSYSDVDRVAKLIPMGSQGFPMTIDNALKTTPELKKIYNKEKEVKELLDLSRKVEGNTRHISVHACALVVSPDELVKFSPLQREPGGGDRVITQYEHHACEDVGLIKLDILGIRNLSIMSNAIKIIKKLKDIDIDIKKVPLDDEKTFKVLAKGETFGVFQLASSGMTRYLVELKPERIEDIMAMVALYRPGPMSFIPEYIKRKHNPEIITYFDPRMKEYLSASYGILTYQDDVLYTAINLAGYNWAEADKFRKAIGKKIPEEMEKQHSKFVEGCVDNGMKRDKAEELFGMIETFAAYGFNKCVTGDTKVIVNHQPISIDELRKKRITESSKILSLNNDNQITDLTLKNIVDNGKKPVLTLKSRSGRNITTTGNHPFLTFTGWKDLKDLKSGDRIAISSQLPSVKNKNTLNLSQAAILGYLISDGNLCHPHGVYFYNSSKKVIDDYLKILSHFSNTRATLNTSKSAVSVYASRINQKLPSPVFELIKKYGLHNKKATQKFIPPVLFACSLKTTAVFLAKLFQGDGCFDTKSLLIYYATSSPQLAQDVQSLLLKFGIQSQKYQKEFKTKSGKKTGWTINISHFSNLSKFNQYIGKYLVGKKKEALETIIKHPQTNHKNQPNKLKVSSLNTLPKEIMVLIREEMSQRNITVKQISTELNISPRSFNSDKRKKGYTRELIALINQKLNSSQIKKHLNSQIYWDEVISIKDSGIQKTYDLTIEPSHNFLANDFIVHNSHAASYGMVAYWTAYIKAHYPVEYMTALMSAEATHTDKLVEAINECERLGIRVLPPDINESLTDFTIVDISKDQWLSKGRVKGEGKAIRFGLNAVKNVGGAALEVILETRKDKPFTSFSDFIHKVNLQKVNKRVVESLISTGAMDRFGTRASLIAYLPQIREAAVKAQKDKVSGQVSLFGATQSVDESHDKLPDMEEMPLIDLLKAEKALLGVYLTDHPAKNISRFIQGRSCRKINSITNDTVNHKVTIAGIIGSVRLVNTKKNNSRMAFASLEDDTGNLDLVIFPQLYSETKEIWESDKMIVVDGRVDNRDDVFSVLVENVEVVSMDKEYKPPVDIVIPHGTSKEKMQGVNALLKGTPGSDSVSIVIKNGGEDKRIPLPYTSKVTPGLKRKIEEIIKK